MYYDGRFNPMSIIAFPKIAVSRDLKYDCATQFRQRQLTSKSKERSLLLLSQEHRIAHSVDITNVCIILRQQEKEESRC